MKVYIRNRQRLIKVNRQRITDLLRKSLRLLGLPKAELSILLVNDRRMRMLNRQYRLIDCTTDVLSFPQYENPPLPPFTKGGRGGITESRYSNSNIALGDIVINLHMAKRQAEENGLSLNEEMKRLLIHGLLHLVGHDHERGGYAEKKMKRLSDKLLQQLAKH